MKWDKVIDELNKKHIGDRKAKEVVFLCSIGRLVKKKWSFSFNVIAFAGSSAGKDHLMTSVLKIFDREDYEIWSRTSKTTFNYLHTLDEESDWNYNGKIVLLKEISKEALNNEIMKEFTSGEEEISRVAITRPKGAGVNIKEIRGHPCVFCTTATTRPTPEIMTRFSIVKLDESEEQTRATRRAYWNSEYSPKVKGFLANLKMLEVKIPQDMFNFIDKVFPINKIRYRRDFHKFLDWVRAVAVFHQAERVHEKADIIVAEWEDYNIAKEVFMNAYTGVADIPLKTIEKKIIEVIEQVSGPLSAKDITNALSGIISLQGIYPHIKNLKNTGILEGFELRDTFGNMVTKYDLSEEFKDKNPIKLPLYEECIKSNKGIKGNKSNKGNKEKGV